MTHKMTQSLSMSLPKNRINQSLKKMGYSKYSKRYFEKGGKAIHEIVEENQLLKESIEARNLQLDRLIEEKRECL